jgi:DNA polymerase-1
MSDIKKCFTSRWPSGYIVDVDWSQLEVVMLQVETQDSVLKRELVEGIDLHCALTADVHHVPYSVVYEAVKAGDAEWTKRRKIMKAGRFALQYGAGAKKISEQTGFSLDEAENFIKTYYAKYRGIDKWNQSVKAHVLSSAKPTGLLDKDGEVVYKGQYIGPNGRRYVFTGTKNKWGKLSFPPTKLQNYPIQGLASDFVKMMRSRVNKEIYKHTWSTPEKILHINTVHDSIMYDCVDSEAAKYAIDCIDNVYRKAREYLSSMLESKRDVMVPFHYSVKTTKHWS